MAQCDKCGSDIAFKRVNGKWWPTNPDGSSHWDDCKRSQRAGKGHTPEAPRVTEPHAGITHVWRGAAGVPWDDALGDFRDFTPLEKADGIVCEPLPPQH